MGNLEQGEHKLALTHSCHWKKGDLIIYDRGYPSYNLIYEHISAKIDCLIRVKTPYGFSGVSSFVASEKKTLIAELSPAQNQSFKRKPYGKDSTVRVRLVRVELANGEVEVLITTLLDSRKYPNGMFGQLYFFRWGIESFYDELKNKLKVEHFTGYSENTIRQDFQCAIFISNR
nr:transposase [Pedobacter sp. MR2016-19]